MAAGNHQFENEAPLAAGMVVAIGSVLLESKLETIISRLHFPMLHAWVQWWPLLLIVAGVVLLFTDRAPAARETKQSRFADAAPEIRW